MSCRRILSIFQNLSFIFILSLFVLGLFAYFIYHSLPLSLVMTLAMMLNLLLAALLGVLIPLTLHRLGRDPATGSSVLITAVTDSGGFFIFLGLATIFLV